jgi:sterol desaturase/sphingolipid hydroxylase (fatty acid hydroxylase superfamily)
MENTFFLHLDAYGQMLAVYIGSLLRYVVIAGGAFLFFYVLFRKAAQRFRIQPAFPEKKKIRMEVLFSLATFVIFSLEGLLGLQLQEAGIARMYFHFSDYPAWWFWLSIPAMLLLHDTWFYWTHRFMHLKWVFPWMHKVHHLSNNPTPWASFSFHPTEAIVEGAIFPLIVLVMPVHPVAILVFLIAMTIMNVIGHLGYELFPSGFTRRPVTRLSNTSTHHNMHHRLVKCNYGLYFNFWDRIMGTNHERYDAYFEEVVAKRKQNA